MSFWNVLLVIIVILAILLVVLYILGSRMQKRQAEQQTMIDASKQTVSILAIDKKKLKIGDSGLPKMVIDQTPWYMKWAKLPIVKAKIGPKVVTMIADEKVFLQLPLRTEAKVVISGLYITEIKSVRGGIPPLPKKKKFFDRFKKNTEEAAKKEKKSLELKGIAQYMDIKELSRPIVEELVDVIYFYDPEHIEVVWNFKDDLPDYTK